MKIKIVLMFVCLMTLFAGIANAKPVSVHTKPKTAKQTTKVDPWTLCAWGSGNGTLPAGWQELRCGKGPKPYALTPASTTWDDVEVLKPVTRVISVGSELTLGVNVKGGKEYVYTVPSARLPHAKVGQWYSADPAIVATFKALEKRGELPILDQVKNAGVVDETIDPAELLAAFSN